LPTRAATDAPPDHAEAPPPRRRSVRMVLVLLVGLGAVGAALAVGGLDSGKGGDSVGRAPGLPIHRRPTVTAPEPPRPSPGPRLSRFSRHRPPPPAQRQRRQAVARARLRYAPRRRPPLQAMDRSHPPERGATPGGKRKLTARDRVPGDIHLYANHGWVVSGGPGPVQAPGRYRWPCGAYQLRALSRMDPAEQRQLSATVERDHTTVVDLRR